MTSYLGALPKMHTDNKLQFVTRTGDGATIYYSLTPRSDCNGTVVMSLLLLPVGHRTTKDNKG